MKVTQNRTYVLQDVTEQELDDLWFALRVAITHVYTKEVEGIYKSSTDARKLRMESLAELLYNSSARGDF